MQKELLDKTLEQVKQSYDSISSDFARTRQKSWAEIDVLLPKYLRAQGKILDVGCGNGRLVGSLAELGFDLFYTGLDNSTNLLAQAWENFGFQYKQVKIVWQEGDMQNLPFSDNVFDVVFAIASLHHLPSTELRQQALAEFNRVLKKEGILIMTNWNLFTLAAFMKYKLWQQVFGNLKKGFAWGDFIIPWKNQQGEVQAWRYYHSFSQKEINSLLRKTGFSEIYNQSSWLNKHKNSVAKSIVTVAKKIDKLA